jgi:hypothetical protein
MEEKNKLKRNLTDEELDVFFRTNYPFQMYPQGGNCRGRYLGKTQASKGLGQVSRSVLRVVGCSGGAQLWCVRIIQR